MQTHEVPTLPVLIPVTAAAVAVTLWWLHRHGRLTGARATVAIVACVYGAVVLGHVLLPLPIDMDNARPWRASVHLTPFVDVAEDPIGMILNVALFVPLGALLPLLTRVTSMRRAAFLGLCVSLSIETVQLAGSLTVSPGRVADVDDLIGNTVGTMIGYAAYSLLAMAPAVRRLLDRAASLANAA
ncbi:VanZ family protein [Aeromicrobium sp. SMF47]|uniref:VanZ family protein n=1 Tax=Aeromicrobium yanjiei TaxID=2662028 RepID=UPI00129DFC1F|nr:VanZ family protein [Aeromicrobium yanjiei]MRJ75524.1 VanZ family protein [Aeromicrobium yanjiei]